MDLAVARWTGYRSKQGDRQLEGAMFPGEQMPLLRLELGSVLRGSAYDGTAVVTAEEFTTNAEAVIKLYLLDGIPEVGRHLRPSGPAGIPPLVAEWPADSSSAHSCPCAAKERAAAPVREMQFAPSIMYRVRSIPDNPTDRSVAALDDRVGQPRVHALAGR